MVYTFIFAFWEIKFFWLLRPFKTFSWNADVCIPETPPPLMSANVCNWVPPSPKKIADVLYGRPLRRRHSCSFRTNFVSFRTSRRPLYQTTPSWLGLFFTTSYSKIVITLFLRFWWEITMRLMFIIIDISLLNATILKTVIPIMEQKINSYIH